MSIIVSECERTKFVEVDTSSGMLAVAVGLKLCLRLRTPAYRPGLENGALQMTKHEAHFACLTYQAAQAAS